MDSSAETNKRIKYLQGQIVELRLSKRTLASNKKRIEVRLSSVVRRLRAQVERLEREKNLLLEEINNLPLHEKL